MFCNFVVGHILAKRSLTGEQPGDDIFKRVWNNTHVVRFSQKITEQLIFFLCRFPPEHFYVAVKKTVTKSDRNVYVCTSWKGANL